MTAQILIGTPGRLLELLKRELLHMRTVRMLVLNRPDLMLEIQGADQILRLPKVSFYILYDIVSTLLFFFVLFLNH